MGKFIDLTGMKTERLTVLRRDGSIIPTRWICKCTCGNEVSIATNCLRCKDPQKSCGCLQKEKAREQAHDLTGMVFDRLTVIEKVECEKKSNGLRTAWLCRCECGNTVIHTQKELMHSHGKVGSCGCKFKEYLEKPRDLEKMGFKNGTNVNSIRENRPLNKNNTSGVKGVHWSSREETWIAVIGVQRKSITLGRFKNFDEAVNARKEAEEKYFKPLREQIENERGNEDG